MPATIASYQTISWNLDKFWTALNELVDTFSPGLLANVEQQIAGPKGEGLKFQRDIFGPLGDRITVLSDFKKPVSEKSQRYLVAVDLADAKAFQNTLNKIIELAQASPKKREFQGVTVYDFDVPDMPNAGNANLPKSVSLAIAKDHLFAATDPSLLEQILRGGGPSLTDNPDFQALAKSYPAKSSMLSYQRPDESARVLYDMVKNGQFKQALDQARRAGGQGGPEMGNLFDVNKLPEFSVFAKYLTQSGGYSEPDKDGFTFTQFALKKAQP